MHDVALFVLLLVQFVQKYCFANELAKVAVLLLFRVLLIQLKSYVSANRANNINK